MQSRIYPPYTGLLRGLKSSMRHILQNEFYTVLLIALISILIDILYVNTFAASILGKYPWGDALSYFNMSYSPFSAVVSSPFVYRVLTPFLVYLIPIDHLIGFKLVNYSAIFFTSILFYYYLRKLNFSRLISTAGILFLLFSPITIYNIYNYCLTDSLSFLFFLLAFYGILTKNRKLYFIALTIGILNRETILFAVPLFFIYGLRETNLKESIKSTFLLSLPALAVFLGIRYLLRFGAYYNSYSTGTLVIMIENFAKVGLPILYQLYMPFGILWVLFVVTLIKKKIKSDFLKSAVWLVPLMALQILVAGDIFRVIFLAFPIIIPIALYYLREKISLKSYFALSGICVISMALTIIFWYKYRLAAVGNIVLEIYTLILLFILLYSSHGNKGINNSINKIDKSQKE
jgi:hypothetical protein